jgi:autotransporter-associated beta strand protein
LAGFAAQLQAQIAVSGTRSAGYGSPLSTQTINTGFGDSTLGDGSSGGGSELDAAYATVQGGELYVFLSGNFEAGTNANHVNLFIDNGSGQGQNVLAAGSSGFLGGLNGSVFSPGFNATYALDANDYQNTFYLDQYDLINNKANYFGSIPLSPIVAGQSTGGIGNNQNLSGLKVGFNNTNAAGVNGTSGTAADPVAADAVSTGLEYGIPLSALGNPAAGSTLKILADVNGSSNGYLSNQFLPGLPVGSVNVGSNASPYAGPTAGAFNLSSIANDWISVTLPNTLPNGTWLPTGGGSWGTSADWSNGYIPHVAGDVATFASATADSTVTLDGARTVGSLAFSSTFSYTLAAGTGGVLTLDNGANPATISDLTGTHTISAPVVLNSNTSVSIVNHGDLMTISGNISGVGSLTVQNQGGTSSLVLSGTNSYSGGTIISGGNLQLGSSTALPTGTALTLNAVDLPPGVLDLNGFNATVSSLTVLTGPNTTALGAVGQIINTSATPGTATLTYAGSDANPSTFADGNITDNSASGGGTTALLVSSGSLTLSGTDTYGGGTTVSGGTLTLSTVTAIPTASALTIGAAGKVVLAVGAGDPTLSTLTMATGATLDINNNRLFLSDTAGEAAALIQQLKKGYSTNWAGPGGIISTAASTTKGYGVGFGEGSVFARIPSGEIELSYTLYGDINQDGAVNGTDFGILAGNFGKNVTGGWEDGDLTYAGSVNGTDFGLLAGNFGKSATGQAIALPAADWAALDAFAAAHGLTALLPEPTSFAVLGVVGVGILNRRRRKEA